MTVVSTADVADYRLRLGDANDPAGKTTTCVPGGLRFQIIGLFMDDNCVTNDRLGAGEFHHLVTPFEMSLARRVCFNVAQVAGVTIRRIRGAVRFMHRIKMTPGGTSIARGAITELVNVETVFARRKTGDISDNFYFLTRSGEGNYAANVASSGWMQDGDRFRRFLRAGQANTEKQG
jgi:hypothetical protein